MIRVLLKLPIEDEDILAGAASVNSVMVDGSSRMALYYRDMPLPESLDVANILDVFDTNA